MTDYFNDFTSLKDSIVVDAIGGDAGMGGPFLTIADDVKNGFEITALIPMVVDYKDVSYSVYVAYNRHGCSIRTDNDFLHGVLSGSDAREKVKLALKKAKDNKRTVKSIMDKYASHNDYVFVPNDSNDSDLLEIESGLFATAIKSVDSSMFDALTATFNEAYPMANAGTGKSTDSFMSVIERYAFKKSLIIEGDPGSGKTYISTIFAKKFNNHLLQGHENIEPTDVIGYLMPAVNDKGEEIKVWKDGPLTAAFRDASKGMKTVLVVDEILRIPARERSAFTSALAPDPDGFYTLVTDRVVSVVDGVATGEVLKAHKDDLCIIGTTNVGAEYDIDMIEPAFGERFRFLRRDTTPEMIKDILFTVGAKFGYEESIAVILFDFYQGLCKFELGGKLARKPNVRHFVDILELADGVNGIKREVKQSLPMWCGRTINGRLIDDEVAIVEMLINDLL